jgi:hypothetical protein
MKTPTWSRRRKPLTWIRDGECIRCTSHRLDSYGYPRMTRGGRNKHVVRHILLRRLGSDLPVSIVSRHTCDNRWCIRPDHIISGTQAENYADYLERGTKRDQWGEKNPYAKFTSDLIQQIRNATGMQKDMIKRFGVSKSQISRIRRRETWTHL